MNLPALTTTAIINLRSDIVAFRAMSLKIQQEFSELGLLFERIEYFTDGLLGESIDDLPLSDSFNVPLTLK